MKKQLQNHHIIMIFRPGFRSSSVAPRCTLQISRGDSFGIQCCYKPSPKSILIAYSGNTSHKVEPQRITYSMRKNQIILAESIYVGNIIDKTGRTV